MCVGAAVQYMRQDPCLHIIAHTLHYAFISTCVWCSSLFEHQAISQVLLSLDMRATAVPQREDLQVVLPTAHIVAFMPSVWNPVLVTSSWLSWLRNSVGVSATPRQRRQDCPVMYRSLPFHTWRQILPDPAKAPQQISSKADARCAASGRQGSGNAAAKTRLPSPTPPPPPLGANPFVALAPPLRLWSCHLKNHLH